jgi:uncharacterized FlgJ-related protein
MLDKLFGKKNKKSSKFSEFIRGASSREKKKVFMDVLKESTEDQRKVINRAITTKTA